MLSYMDPGVIAARYHPPPDLAANLIGIVALSAEAVVA